MLIEKAETKTEIKAEAKENREYKSSMFVDLFSEDEQAEANSIAIYNALHDEPLPEGTIVEKIKVDGVLYKNFKNDISMGIGGKVLVFGEHQSTINENMPLRSLMYIGRAYEKIVPVRDRYKRKRVTLPKPEFYTFYNGEEDWAKEKVLKLSDAYRLSGDESMLDLEVRVININPEKNHEVLNKCPVLKEYGQFVSLVRQYEKTGDPEAIKHAVEECIRKGILAEYLRKKGSEVVNMLIAEYDYDMDIEVQREEAFEDGLERGLKRGLERGLKEGLEREKKKLILRVCKKLQKGRSAAEIADELEEEEAIIQPICDAAKECGTDYDIDRIYTALNEKNM